MSNDNSDEGISELPKNPDLRTVVPSLPDDRTAMIDVEAIAAKRAARDDNRAAEELARKAKAQEEEADEQTGARTGEGHDRDATGTYARKKKKARDETRIIRDEQSATRAAPRTVEDAPEPGTQKSRVRTGLIRPKTAEATVAAPEKTTVGARKFPKVSPIAAAAAAVIFLCLLMAAVFVAVRATGVITIATIPTGASILLDGEAIGTSPLQKRVRSGPHTIELNLDKHRPFREVVDVPSAGLSFQQPLELEAPPPPPPPTAEEQCDDIMQQAKRLFERGDLDGAAEKVAACRALMDNHAASVDLRAAIGRAIVERDAAQRRSDALAAAAGKVSRARSLLDEGRRAYESNKHAIAREKLYESLKLDGSNPEPHRVLAKVWNRDSNVDKVRYHLERYLALGGADGDFKVREWLKTHKPK
jgi:PEGA domain